MVIETNQELHLLCLFFPPKGAVEANRLHVLNQGLHLIVSDRLGQDLDEIVAQVDVQLGFVRNAHLRSICPNTL